MKCDVCGTKIPLGVNECPHCGYKMGKSSVNTYDASGSTHEHIKVVTAKSQKQNRINNAFAKMKIVGIVGLIVAIFVFIALISIPRYLAPEYLEDQSSYQELFGQGYDEDLIQEAIDDRNDLVEFFRTKIGIEEPDVNEYSQKEDNITQLDTEVTGYLSDCVYGIKYSYATGADVKKSMYIIGDTEQSIKEADWLEADQEILDLIGEKIGIKQLYEMLNNTRPLLKPEDDDMTRFSYNGDNIYLSEEYYQDTNPRYYSYYCSIKAYH